MAYVLRRSDGYYRASYTHDNHVSGRLSGAVLYQTEEAAREAAAGPWLAALVLTLTEAALRELVAVMAHEERKG